MKEGGSNTQRNGGASALGAVSVQINPLMTYFELFPIPASAPQLV